MSDLGRAVGVSESKEAGPRRILSGIGGMLAILGIGSYGVARFTVDGFLEPFHLSYVDVGLQYADLVANGAMLTVPLAGGVGLVLIRDDLAERIRRQKARALLIVVVLAFDAILISILASLLLVTSWLFSRLSPSTLAQNALEPIATIFVLVFAGAGGMTLIFDSVRFVRKNSSPTQPTVGGPLDAPKIPRGGLDAMTVVLSMSLICATCTILHAVGGYLARSAELGNRVDIAPFGMGMPGLRAEPVVLYTPNGTDLFGAVGEAPPVTAAGARPDAKVFRGECLLFLGTGDGVSLLYRVRDRSVLRLAAESVTITEQLGRDTC